jgi:hypothetical protein
MLQKHFLFQYKGETAEYFTSIRSEEENVSEVSANFTKEIRNNILNFESKEKIKKYLEQIQSKMNVVYECLELDRQTPQLVGQSFHHSFPSIQNLIRDIAIKNSIEISGDVTGLTVIPQPAKNLSDIDLKLETPTFTNNFDNINPTEIYKHFKDGLVEKGYLTEQELNEYLKAAFELKTKPETLFKLKHTPTKQRIYTVFYIYYKDISQKKHERQKEYAALLGDFFEGYKTDTIKTNWAREYKPKR